VREALAANRGGWADATAIGRLRPPDAAGLLQVMAHDDIYYGSRRMSKRVTPISTTSAQKTSKCSRRRHAG